MKRANILIRFSFLFALIVFMGACTTDDLEPSTEQNKTVETGISSVGDIYSIIKGAYSGMTSDGYYGRDYIITNEVRTDNCFSNGNSGRFTTQASFTYDANSGYFWDNAYYVIANANIVANIDVESLEGDQVWGNHLKGQALAMRALAHFDLVKQYGQQHVEGTLGVPYVKEFKGEDLFLARNTVDEVVGFIFQDLNDAYALMDAAYDESSEFITKMGVKAIEANVAVYFERWSNAISACETVINSGQYSIIPADQYVAHWASDMSVNSIFELAFSETDNVGINGLAYIYRTTGGGSYGDVQVLDEVANLYEAGDVRAGILGMEGDMLRNIGKYPNNQGYDNVVIIRYEEVILNYAEALLESGDAAGALTQINLITSNRGAAAYTSVTKDDILNERRKEFIFEGKRYEDLIRAGKDIEWFSLQQNITETIPYGDYRTAWPIPQNEIDANSNMVQNTGY